MGVVPHCIVTGASSLTAGYLTRWNGTSFVNSFISQSSPIGGDIITIGPTGTTVQSVIVSSSISSTGNITAPSFIGTSSWATNALTASFITPTGTNAFVQDGNSFGATAVLGTNDNNSLGLETNGSTRLFISSSGNVGIGTGTPTNTLNVNGTTFLQGGQTTVRGSGATSATTALRVENSATTARLTILDDGTSAFNTSHLYISSSGNVGIGTTNPLSLLHISASSGNEFLRITSGSQNILNVRSGSVVFFAGTGVAPSSGVDLDIQGTGTANGGSVRIAGNGTAWGFGSVSSVNRTGTGNSDMFNVTMGGTSINLIQNPLKVEFNANQNATSGSGYIVLRLNATHASTAGTGSKLLQTWEFAGTQLNVVSSSGAMGIGVTTPSALLHISGASNSNLLRISSPTNTNILFVSGSGNVGIGTSTPAFRLDVSGSAKFGTGSVGFASGLGQIHAVDRTGAYITATQTSSSIVTFMGADSNGGIVGTYSNHKLLIRTNNSDKITIEPTNIGIQQSTPAEWIHLSSDPSTSKYIRIDATKTSNDPNFIGDVTVMSTWGNIDDTRALGTPDVWMEIKLNGNIVLIPCYYPS